MEETSPNTGGISERERERQSKDSFRRLIVQADIVNCDIVCYAAYCPDAATEATFEEVKLRRECQQDMRDLVAEELNQWKKPDRDEDWQVREYASDRKLGDNEIAHLTLDGYPQCLLPMRHFLQVLNSEVDSIRPFTGDDLFVQGMRFYVIVFNLKNPLFCFCRYSPQRVISHNRRFGLSIGDNGEFARVNKPVFLINDHIDCFVRCDNIFVIKEKNFHDMFFFTEEVTKAAEITLDGVQKLNLITNYSIFAEACLKSSRAVARLATQVKLEQLRQKALAEHISVINEHGLDIQYNRFGIIFQPEFFWDLLYFLSDDYSRTSLGGQNIRAVGKSRSLSPRTQRRRAKARKINGIPISLFDFTEIEK